MSKYTESEITNIINQCEILILPDYEVPDDASTSIEYVPLELQDSNAKTYSSEPKIPIKNRQCNEEGAKEGEDEDFEQIYQLSKSRKQNIVVCGTKTYYWKLILFTFCLFYFLDPTGN
jgi:hypothetical protein